jgi:hypothetical protein
MDYSFFNGINAVAIQITIYAIIPIDIIVTFGKNQKLQ